MRHNANILRYRPKPLTVFVLLAVAALLLVYRRDIPHAARAIIRASPGWLAVLLASALVGILCVGLVYCSSLRAADAGVSSRDAAALGVAAYALNLVVKSSGLAGLALFVRYVRARGLAQGPVVAGYLVATFLNHVAFAAVLVAAIAALVVHGRFTPIDALASGVFVLYLAAQLIAVYVAVHRPTAIRRLYGAFDRLVARWRFLLRRAQPDARSDRGREAEELHTALRLFATRPAATLRAGVWALSLDVIHVVWLWAALRAVGAEAGIDVALVTYGVATLFGIVGFLPAGLGFFEVGMAATLSTYSVPIAYAAATVVLFRLAELWLPLAAGGVASRMVPATKSQAST